MAAIPTEPETAMSTATNRQFRLASRPRGAATRENFSFHAEPVAQPAEDGVLVKNLMLSLDPAMRGWMNEGKSYIPPVGIGEVMRAGGVGTVVASKNAKFAVGDTVSAGLGVQEYCLVPGDQIQRNGMFKIDLRVGTMTQWLNVLGMPAMTMAWRVADPRLLDGLAVGDRVRFTAAKGNGSYVVTNLSKAP